MLRDIALFAFRFGHSWRVCWSLHRTATLRAICLPTSMDANGADIILLAQALLEFEVADADLPEPTILA